METKKEIPKKYHRNDTYHNYIESVSCVTATKLVGSIRRRRLVGGVLHCILIIWQQVLHLKEKKRNMLESTFGCSDHRLSETVKGQER